ncbi:hypothetical protein PAXINDRAFT_20385 [Paxillus involutus ATCC 200175]|uniref:Uncharacterized protein n=1 Tax=Paxillus involutus ATCC 200175 TaxID=664439 RepID=A0A0C9TGK8_PAXIN|nr:hypothetical protein PAXINDRAFT_20385 [Paxillus involutus ATCC 200175]
MAEIPQLRADGRNWMEYREKLLRVAAQQKLDKLYDGTETLQGDAEDWQQRNAIAKSLIVETIPDSIFLQILHYESAHKFFEALKNLFEKDIATLELLQELRNNRSKREAMYGLESANDRVRRRSHVTDASRRDDEVSNRSGRRSVDVPRSEPRPERKREPKRQGRVEKRPGVGEEGRESRGRDDERVAAASEPGNGATDQTTSGVSLVKPTSSQDSPEARVDSPPHHHHSVSPTPSPSTPKLLFEQTAPTSRRPTRQRTQQELEEAARRYLARRKREDGEGSRRGVESRDRGSREADNEDGEDVDVHRADVAPQQPQTVGQTADDDEAADTTDPHANSAGPAVPVGTTNGPPNESNGGRDRERGRNVEEEDEKGGRASESAALSSNDDGGDEDVRHAYVVPKPASPSPNHVPPPPDESRPPPSVSLEGEMSGKQSSDHADEAATHLERPPDESTTTPPVWTPPDEKSSGEGRGMAMSHREAVGGDDKVEGSNDGRETLYRVEETPNEVDGSDDAASTSYGVDDERSRRGGARDQATGDQEGREVEETRMNEGEECRTSVQARSTTNVDGHGQYTPNEGNSPQEPPPLFPHHPEPPPAFHPPSSPSSPNHPERPCNVDDTKSNKTPARHRADALHDPGGQTDAPDSVPPSVRLEGERNRLTSLYVEVDHVETDDDHAEDDDHAQQPSRHPVGTTDGDERRPSEPTEPPDEKEGEREVDGELGDKSKVETRVEMVEGVGTKKSRRVDKPEVEEVETKSSRRGDEPRGREDEESRSREVEGKEGGQSEGDACQRDGRTNDTGDATSSASCNSSRVETGALAEHEDGQHRDGIRNASMNVPGPPSPLPYAMPRPTHIANPPCRRGRLKTPPTNVSKPERTEYAPSHTVVSTTTSQFNRMRRKRYGATGGVSQSHHSRGRRAPRPVHRHRTPSTPHLPPTPANYHIG